MTDIEKIQNIEVNPWESRCWWNLIIKNSILPWLYEVVWMWWKDYKYLEISEETNWNLLWTFTSNYNNKKKDGDISIKRWKWTEFTPKWIKDKNWNLSKKNTTTKWEHFTYWEDFQQFEIANMEWIIELDNWMFLINEYWKYKPDLSFLSKIPEIKYQDTKPSEFNLPKWELKVLYWDYFVSKKWTNCFKIKSKEEAKHILIQDDRWWAFNSYKWNTLPENGSTYYKRARSNGWWTWYDYWIYPKNWKYKLSENNI